MKLVSISAVRLVIIVMVAYVIVLVQSDSTFIFLAPVSSTNVKTLNVTGNKLFDELLTNRNGSGRILVIRTSLRFTFKFFTEVLFLSIILCLANTGIVNVLVSTLYSKPDEVTGYECGLYSTKGGRLKDRISFYTVGLTMMIFDVEVVLTFAFLLSLTFATTSSFLSVGIFVVILGLDLFQELYSQGSLVKN